jgi:hypothetical protein
MPPGHHTDTTSSTHNDIDLTRQGSNPPAPPGINSLPNKNYTTLTQSDISPSTHNDIDLEPVRDPIL